MGKYRIPFDYFSLPVKGFNLKGQDSSKSWLGFLLTLAFFGLVMAIFITELVSMANRDSMSVTTSEEGVPLPPATSIKNVLMAFGVMNRQSILLPLIENVDFNIKAEMVTMAFDETKQISQQMQSLTISKCTDADFGDQLDLVKEKLNIPDFFCISKDQDDELLTLQGQAGSDIFKGIKVTISCGPPGLASGSACPASFFSSNLLFMYGYSYMNVSNYENPITIVPTLIRDYADRVSYHEKTILVTPRTIITDRGLVFSDEESQPDLIISEGASLSEGLNLLTPEIFRFYINLNPSRIVVKREYKMILDVLASTTGIASTVALVVSFLIRPYIEEKTHSDVMKTLSPEKHKPISLKEYIRALIGNKEAKYKVKATIEEKEWIKENLDMIKMLKNWSDFEKMKKIVLTGQLQEMHDINSSFVVEKNSKALLNNSEDHSIAKVHPG